MEIEKELLKRKALAIYQILLGFVIVDGKFMTEEGDIILGYLLESFPTVNKDELSTVEHIKNIAEDEENFTNNAVAIRMTSTKDEMIELLLFISDILFIDKEFHDREFELFTKLMQAWDIGKQDLKR